MTAKFQGHTLHAGSWAKYTRNSPGPSKSLLQAWAVKSQLRLQLVVPQAQPHCVTTRQTLPLKKAEATHHSQELGAPMSIPQIPVYMAMSYSVVPAWKVHFSLALKINTTLTLKPFSPDAKRGGKTGRHLLESTDE